MRRAVYSTLAVLLLAQAAGGCAHFKKTPAAGAVRYPSGPAQGPVRRALQAHHGGRAPRYGSPPVGTVTYPYYTVRGPRDFLADDPPSIGR